jgi:hypothetical protein
MVYLYIINIDYVRQLMFQLHSMSHLSSRNYVSFIILSVTEILFFTFEFQIQLRI